MKTTHSFHFYRISSYYHVKICSNHRLLTINLDYNIQLNTCSFTGLHSFRYQMGRKLAHIEYTSRSTSLAKLDYLDSNQCVSNLIQVLNLKMNVPALTNNKITMDGLETITEVSNHCNRNVSSLSFSLEPIQ